MISVDDGRICEAPGCGQPGVAVSLNLGVQCDWHMWVSSAGRLTRPWHGCLGLINTPGCTGVTLVGAPSPGEHYGPLNAGNPTLAVGLIYHVDIVDYRITAHGTTILPAGTYTGALDVDATDTEYDPGYQGAPDPIRLHGWGIRAFTIHDRPIWSDVVITVQDPS